MKAPAPFDQVVTAVAKAARSSHSLAAAILALKEIERLTSYQITGPAAECGLIATKALEQIERDNRQSDLFGEAA